MRKERKRTDRRERLKRIRRAYPTNKENKTALVPGKDPS